MQPEHARSETQLALGDPGLGDTEQVDVGGEDEDRKDQIARASSPRIDKGKRDRTQRQQQRGQRQANPPGELTQMDSVRFGQQCGERSRFGGLFDRA